MQVMPSAKWEMWAILGFLLVSYTQANLLAFDCGSTTKSTEAYSALEIDDCDLGTEVNTSVRQRKGQVLQVKEHEILQVFSCKVKIRAKIFYCGRFSINYLVHNSYFASILEFDKETCEKLVSKGTLSFQGIEIKGIPVNKIFYKTVEAYGHIDDSGTCQGVDFTTSEGTFTSSVYVASLEIFTSNNTLSYNINSNMVVLGDLTECDVTQEFCLSLSLGYVFNTMAFNTDCESNGVDTLFSGNLTQVFNDGDMDINSLVSIDEDNMILSLRIKLPLQLCGRSVFATDHPGLLVAFKDRHHDYKFKEGDNLLVDNINPLAYHSSKLVFVKHNLEANLRKLFFTLALEDCNIRRTILAQRIRDLRRRKVMYRNILNMDHGSISYIAGDTFYVSACKLVEVSSRDSDECSLNLPITYKASKRYLDTADRVITTVADVVPCSTLAPPTFFINGHWIHRTPNVIPAKTPRSVHPKFIKFNFTFVENIVGRGLYTQENLRNYSRFLSHFSGRRKAIDGIIKDFGHYSYGYNSSFSTFLGYLTSKFSATGNKGNNVGYLVYIGAYMGLIIGGIYAFHIGLMICNWHSRTRILYKEVNARNLRKTLDPIGAVYDRLKVADSDIQQFPMESENNM